MKMINRNNYEEFFLLYVDDELDAVSKLAVEDFIQQNTDLAIELEMLIQAKSLPEEIVFSDKESLLRTEGININETNHEEYFLLYVDNELSTSKREEVEKYVLQHPHLQDEFTLIKQTVLAPETVSYGNKAALYRKEKRRAIYMQPWRLAAAAIFIGVCVTGLLMMQKNTPSVTVAVNTKPLVKSQPVAKTPFVDTVEPNSKQQVETGTQEVLAAKQTGKEKNIQKKTGVATIKKPKENTASKNAVNNEGENDLAYQHVDPSDNDIIRQQSELPSSVNTTADVPDDLSGKQAETGTLPTQSDNIENNGYKIYPVAYKEINTNDDDNSLHVGVFDLNKTKVKNLFKKAGRVFNNRTNDLANEDGKLQVANFEIETKKQ
jgi:anti-sigma factor RsiW